MKKYWEKLKVKWGVETDRRMAWIFLVFSITGSTTAWLRLYLFELFRVDDYLSGASFHIVKWVCIYFFYQILLFTVGSLMGEHQFVKWFVIKMNKRFLPKHVIAKYGRKNS